MAIQQGGTERPLPPPTWRAMTPDDLDGVVAVAQLSFPDHPEERACFANRLELYPEGCFVLAAEGRPVMGYMVAYPWKLNAAPALNVLIDAIPAEAEVVYLHDLALHPDTRGGGFTRPVVERLAEQATAAGWPALALVAVNDASSFWARNGFEIQNPPGMAEKLASYGDDARYMVRPL
ncbi:GNAT family N-acetyltransferase [Brevundimonas guildfordensis]|nr:GNAT family N-acetyltransferase [Brevundimonas guildfordensis]